MSDIEVMGMILLTMVAVFTVSIGIGYITGTDAFFGLLTVLFLCLSALPIMGIYAVWKEY